MRPIKTLTSLLALFAVATLASGCCCSMRKAESAASSQTIVQTATTAKTFTTLVAALKSADLVEALSGTGPFTVFAPTDDAFAKLPAGTIDSLLKPENKEQLTQILTYHVVPGRVDAATVVGLPNAKTLGGQSVDIRVDGSTVMINDARVVQADIECANGIIHVVDTVLLPKS